MKSPKFLVFILSILLLAGCGSALRSRPEPEGASQSTANRVAEDRKSVNEEIRAPSQISLAQADKSQSFAEAMNRKILRNADLTIEVGDPAEVQRRISSIAESFGGFVVTSESRIRQVGDAKQDLEVNLVVRVPATGFATALDQIRATGSRVVQEKITGQDVTEEFIDLEARAKTQKALEAQFLEIMKRASKVEDALEVQRQIAEVRTEIEKLEGRKRFLENRASLSTITVDLRSPAAFAVSPSGFGRSIRGAVVESIDVAGAIVLFLIRFVIVMISIFILLILPGWVIARYFLRRVRKVRLQRKESAATAETQLDSENT